MMVIAAHSSMVLLYWVLVGHRKFPFLFLTQTIAQDVLVWLRLVGRARPTHSMLRESPHDVLTEGDLAERDEQERFDARIERPGPLDPFLLTARSVHAIKC